MTATVTVSSVDEEDSSSGQSGQGVGHLADSGVVDESPEEQQEAWREERKKQRDAVGDEADAKPLSNINTEHHCFTALQKLSLWQLNLTLFSILPYRDGTRLYLDTTLLSQLMGKKHVCCCSLTQTWGPTKVQISPGEVTQQCVWWFFTFHTVSLKQTISCSHQHYTTEVSVYSYEKVTWRHGQRFCKHL